MGILASIDQQVQSQPGPLDDFWYNEVGATSDSGMSITRRSAMSISTFYKCVRWRGQMFGMLPKKLWERTERFGRAAQVEARNHSLYPVIHTAPNPEVPSMAFFEMLSADLDRDGNFYAYIQRFLDSYRVKYLWRLRPDRVRVDVETMRDASTGKSSNRVWYWVSDDHGFETRFYPDEILHVPGLGYDGIRGYNPIRLHMNTLGWNAATTRHGAVFFKNAGRPSAIVNTQVPIKDENVKKDLIKNLTASGKKAGTVVLIEGAITYNSLGMKQDEAQFIETNQLQEEDIAGLMNVKPHKIGIMRNMTNNNVEQQNIEAVTDSLQPLCVRVESWFDLKLLSGERSTGIGGGTEQDRYFHQCELKGMLRGDTAAQTAHIEKMIEKAVYSPNDALDYLGLPGYEGGDTRRVNRAYVPVDMERDILKNERRATTPRRNPDEASAPGFMFAIMRDAVGRALKRGNDRERAIGWIFTPALSALSDWLGGRVPQAFMDDYLSEMGKRSGAWSDPDVVAMDELERAMAAFQEVSA